MTINVGEATEKTYEANAGAYKVTNGTNGEISSVQAASMENQSA